MNKTFRSVWSEASGTFVAVAENVKAKGKSSRSSKKLSGLVGAGLLAVAGTAVGDVQVGDDGTPVTGNIVFTGGSTITGLSTLDLAASLTVNGITIGSSGKITGLDDGNIGSGSSDAVTGGQLHATNTNVASNTSAIGTLGRSSNNR